MSRLRKYNPWLLLCLACWVAAFICYRLYFSSQQPPGAVARVEARLQEEQKDFELLLRDSSVRTELGKGHISKQLAQTLISKDYYVYIGDHSGLIFWNNQYFADTSLFSIAPDSPQLIRRLPFIGVAELIRPGDSALSILACFPVARMYPFENDYLQSQFSVSNSIPSSGVIAGHPSAQALPFHSAQGKVLGYISIPANSVIHIQPDAEVIIFLIAGFLSLLLWIHLVAQTLARNKKYGAAFLFTLSAVVIIRFLAYWPGLPFHLRDTSLFSPELYGYNSFLPSLGDLLLNALFVLWLFWFTAMRIPVSLVIVRIHNKAARIIFALVLIILLCLLASGSAEVLRSLVLDSGLSFDAEALHNARLLTTVGLFIAAIIIFSFAIFFHLVMSLCDALLKKRWWKYSLTAGCFYALIFLFPLAALPLSAHVLLLWLLLSALLWDSARQLRRGPLELPLVMSAAFLCASVATLLFHFNERKNHIHEQRFAERVATETDERLEWYFPTLALRLQHDPAIANFMESPGKDARVILDRQINAYYLTNWLSNYNADLFLFDSCARPLYNADTFAFNSLSGIADQAMQTADDGLFYRGGTGTDHTYLGRLPVLRNGHNIGFIFLDLSRKKATNETVFPELLLPAKLASQATNVYSYAIYSHNQIITQSNDYPFPYYLDSQSNTTASSKIENAYSMSMLSYKADNGRVVLVLHPRSSMIDFMLLFSYLFGLLALAVILFLLYRFLLVIFSGSNFNWHLSLRRRVQLAMLSLVFIAFALIGVATISLIRSRYKNAITAQRLSTMELVSNRMEQYLHETRKTDEISLSDDPEFRLIMARQAYNHSVDINFYDSTGLLLNTTREEIFNNGLLSNRIRPDVLLQPWSALHPYLIIDENIGKLSFTTCYLPLKSSNGQVGYYLNMPFFSSARELNAQISYVVVALVNLYILALLLSGLLTVPLTNWLSGSLKKIIRHLERTDVKGNEPLHWPHDDEIGLLVGEYNKMVQKVEQSATLLARSERESAWREVAQQVAHEIKNPLTPMRLNIQYLQKAIREGRGDVLELTERLSHSLLAQIDHLSQVAGSFSSFASMPEPRPEKIDLNEFVQRVAAMHQEQESVQVYLSLPGQNTNVFADRGQLLSMLTNLIQNAAQSIPADKKDGWVRITVKPEVQWVEIIVADNGVGIPEDQQEKIFTPYFTTKSSGTGLGLAMTRRMVEGAGGTIRFDTSEQGATFIVKLRVAT